MGRRLTPRGHERRTQLMDFAAARFAANGFHPTSVAEIVEGLGVGKGVFYWYFSSKEELFLAIIAEAQIDIRRRQQQAIGDEPDPVRRLALGIRATLEWFEHHRDLFNLFQFAATEERFAAQLRKGQEVAVADTVRHLKDGMVAGSIRDGDPDLMAHALLGTVTQLARVFIHQRGEPAGEVADQAVAFCLEGVLAR